jgi:hypothetical protein
MEAHTKEQSESIISLLTVKGYQVHAEQEDQFTASGIANTYAKRQQDERAAGVGQIRTADRLQTLTQAQGFPFRTVCGSCMELRNLYDWRQSLSVGTYGKR